MDIEKKWMTQSSLDKLMKELIQDRYTILGPVGKDGLTRFEAITSLADTETDYIATNQSAKLAVFPKYEELFRVEKEKGSVQLISKNPEKLPEIVLFGSRPCDAKGFAALQSIFDGDIKDRIFMSRREKLTIISVACVECDDYCFCTSLHSGPGSTEGSDLLLTPDGKNGYFTEVITEKGRQLVEQYPACFEEAPEFDKQQRLADVPVAFDIDKIAGKIPEKFEDNLWIEQSLRCIGCGTCAYVCPACGCFDIQDVNAYDKTVRKRSWDSCGFDLFTLHASGHNPRKVQSQRWRQRIFHKFQYMPESDNVVGCVGCGRCSRSCSVAMNLKLHLINLANEL